MCSLSIKQKLHEQMIDAETLGLFWEPGPRPSLLDNPADAIVSIVTDFFSSISSALDMRDDNWLLQQGKRSFPIRM